MTGVKANRVEDLWALVNKTDNCWIWTGRVSPTTHYGMFSWRSKPYNSHRFIYELLIGSVPQGKDLHHTCGNRLCCNPEHLKPLTRKEHRKTYARLPTNGNEKKTHCLRGHAFTEENTIYRHGSRICKACEKYRGRSGYLKRKLDVRKSFDKYNWGET